jgi:cyclopropane-fatty-acyl-phospholipid synthase
MLEAVVRKRLKRGSLIIRLPGGREIAIGDRELAPIVRVVDNRTALRIAMKPDLALGEAYMDGGLVMDRGDLWDFLEVIGQNMGSGELPGLLARLLDHLHQANDRLTARRNVSHHYDLSRAFYEMFLDQDMQYSCAVFERPGMTLEEAQLAKKRRLMTKLLIEPGMRVLDIGCGWGGLGLTLAEEAQAQVTGVTLSTEQLATARARAEARGLAGRAQFELIDYRDVEGPFDRIVSVGMFEHVGVPNYEAYFQTVRRLLTDDGVAVIHSIGRKNGPSTTQPWIEKYIFPGGYIPALSEVIPAIERAGLWITDVEILRIHYAETLRGWRERFMKRRDEVAAMYDERFCRMWEFYLGTSELAFRYGDHMVFQIQLSRKVDAVPLTRDYTVQRKTGAQPRSAAAA